MTIDRQPGPLPGYSPPVPSGSNGRAHDGVAAPQQSITVSVPAMKTFLMFAGGVVIAVVLSVIATVALIAVMNAGVILPGYSRVNQPAQLSQLGFCVSPHGAVWTPKHKGFCSGGRFIHVQPSVSGP